MNNFWLCIVVCLYTYKTCINSLLALPSRLFPYWLHTHIPSDSSNSSYPVSTVFTVVLVWASSRPYEMIFLNQFGQSSKKLWVFSFPVMRVSSLCSCIWEECTTILMIDVSACACMLRTWYSTLLNKCIKIQKGMLWLKARAVRNCGVAGIVITLLHSFEWSKLITRHKCNTYPIRLLEWGETSNTSSTDGVSLLIHTRLPSKVATMSLFTFEIDGLGFCSSVCNVPTSSSSFDCCVIQLFFCT